ncbi:hypothetical protein OG800_16065 [Streptomyces sp. NBC_00445]|uniref:WXG100 family type VII secretion target n=1 Tax=Streptomyces sp. NBC_00445 TaxID=2975745 RepID=UPI002E1CFF1B
MADQPTMEEWRAELAALKEATQVVRREHTTISGTMTTIESMMNEIATHWSSPSYGTFDQIKTWFNKTERDLEALLDDIASRMDTSYWNYHDAESKNFDNVSDGQP